LKSLAEFQIGEMKFPETKIGDTATRSEDWLSKNQPAFKPVESPAPAATPMPQVNPRSAFETSENPPRKPPDNPPTVAPPLPPKIPAPPIVPLRMRMRPRGK